MSKTGIYTLSVTPLDDSMKGVDNPALDVYDNDDGVHHSEVRFQEKIPHHSDKPYRGMGKDELLRHSSKGIWKTLRYVCMSIVFLSWLALIITVIALVIVYPRCRKPENQSWWQTKTTYRVYVRSFQDSDDNGIGDLKGLTSRLDYLSEIGVGAISLSPIYKQATGKDSDYDIIDHKAINSDYGTMDEFRELVKAVHENGMYLLMDFVPGFTSDEHPWFIASRISNDKNNLMRNYYVWEDGTDASPPSNWKSIYNDQAWKMDSSRNQTYLHQREAAQPDLNLRSDGVNKELVGILKFWLDEGVDGFYIRESGMLLEDYDLTDESKSDTSTSTDPNNYDYYDHKYTYARHENTDQFARWRYFLDNYGNETESYKLLFADVHGDVNVNMDYYGMYNRDGVDYPLNKHFQKLDKDSGSKTIYNTIMTWVDSMPTGRWSNWLGGDDYTNRFTNTRAELSLPMLVLNMLLPGTPFVYYGDEIGMTDSVDPPNSDRSRDQVMRAPMQWNDTSTAGFCKSCTPWFPVNADIENKTVEKEKLDANSMLSLFKNLTTLRQKASFLYGDLKMFPLSGSVISFMKEFDGVNGYIVAVNVGNSQSTLDLSGKHGTLPETAKVVLTTTNAGIYDEKDEDGDKGSLSLSSITLEAFEGVVGTWDYVAKEL